MSFDSTDIDGLGKVDMQESERKEWKVVTA
jgi:hypothetical protein